MTEPRDVIWRQIAWHRPLDPERVLDVLRTWAADQRSQRITLELRSRAGHVTYFLAATAPVMTQTAAPLRQLLNARLVTPAFDRQAMVAAGRITISTRHRPLHTETPESTVHAVLGALVSTRHDEELVVQIVLGPRRVPLFIPSRSPAALVAPWWQTAWQGDGGQIDSEKRRVLRAKVANHGFACSIRLGVAADVTRRRELLLGLMRALRTTEAPGVHLRLMAEKPSRLNDVRTPWFWPLRLGITELVPLIAWPLGDDDLPGQPARHPRLLPPSPGQLGQERVLAAATAPDVDGALSLPIQEALHHLHVIGPTGTGKSTLLAHLIRHDIAAGRGVVVIEPKGDLVEDVLQHIPPSRAHDVVVLDPSDSDPVGLNPLAGAERPELAADRLLSIFKQLYGAAIGPRSQDILWAGLLTLARRPDASLAMLPLLLTNPGFRRSLTQGLHDPLTLEPFWASFNAWSDGERAAAIAPVMNKLRPLLRPGLRGVVGQRTPLFDIARVFTERKILLVPLRRGVIGSEAAQLLGSIVTATLWQAIQARAAQPSRRRSPVMVYIDEVQDYLHVPTDLADALAQARGYGVGFTLAHQYLGQLPREMQRAVLSNTRSRVCFQLPPDDAAIMAKGHPELEPADLGALGRYEVYASLFHRGKVTAYVSGRTLNAPQPTSRPDELRVLSRRAWGRPLDEVEAGFAELVNGHDVAHEVAGRRRRQS